MQQALAGLRIRERRRELGMKQIDLAAAIDVSPPYLNLIESNKRPVGGALLARIAKALAMAPEHLDGTSERRLRDRLEDIASELGSARAEAMTGQIAEMMTRFPDWSRAILSMHRRMQDAAAAEDAMADRLAHDPALGNAVHNMLTEITALRSTSEILAEGGAMPDPQRKRFEAIMFEQSSRLATTGASLADYFDTTARSRRRPTPSIHAEEALAALEGLNRQVETVAERLRLQLEQMSGSTGNTDLVNLMEPALPRAVDLPDEAGFLERRSMMAMLVAEKFGTAFDAILDAAFSIEPDLRTPEAEALARAELARRTADALILPAWKIIGLGKKTGWDVEALSRAADGEVDLTMRRLACLDGMGGPRAAQVTVDASGRVIARRGALDLTPASRQLDCPVWPVHHAPRAMLSVSPLQLGDDMRGLAVAWARPDGMRAEMLIFDMASAAQSTYGAASRGKPLSVGADCRICTAKDCSWRREPAVVG